MSERPEHLEVSEKLRDLIRGELASEDQTVLDEHFRTCASCRSELEAVRALHVEDPAPLTDLERRRLHKAVESSLSSAAPPPRVTARRIRFAQALGAAALLVLVAVGVGSVLKSGAPTPAQERPEVTKPQGGRGAGEAATAEAAAPEAAAGRAAQDAALSEPGAPPPVPEFNPDAGRLTEDDLIAIGESAPPFTAYASAYTAPEVALVHNRTVNALARAAPEEAAADVRTCARVIFDTQTYSILPVYGALGKVRGRRALVVGFVFSDKPRGRLDQYQMWAWPKGDCDGVPLAYLFGQINV